MSMSLDDITNMSFQTRKRVYEMAQANALKSRKVNFIFAAERFQENNDMKTGTFSYMAVDRPLM
jgi:hypothetical protein